MNYSDNFRSMSEERLNTFANNTNCIKSDLTNYQQNRLANFHSRSDIITILNDRKIMRASAYEIMSREKKRIMDLWMFEERNFKKKQLKDFLNRLSDKKRFSVSQKIVDDHDIGSYIAKEKERLKDEIKKEIPTIENNSSPNEHISRKNEQIERDIEKTKENYKKKTEKLIEVQNKRKTVIEDKMQIIKESRDKRILRAKIKKVLRTILGATCMKYPLEIDYSDGMNINKDFQKIFINSFSETEFKQIIDDPIYFIPSKEQREAVGIQKTTHVVNNDKSAIQYRIS